MFDIDKYRKKFPNIKVTSTMSARKVAADTMEEARKKVVGKAIANKLYVMDPEKHQRPDLICREVQTDEWTVGLKYGNRWLIDEQGKKVFITDLTRDEVPKLIDELVADVEAGNFDAAIEAIRKAVALNKAA